MYVIMMPIRRKSPVNQVPRFNPRLAEEILIRAEEIRERIEILRNNRPWENP
jgi:hypothetical protein